MRETRHVQSFQGLDKWLAIAQDSQVHNSAAFNLAYGAVSSLDEGIHVSWKWLVVREELLVVEDMVYTS